MRDVGVFVMAALSIAIAGCSSPDRFNESCMSAIDCEDGNEVDIANCERSFQIEYDAAVTAGCTDQFDASFKCLDLKAECQADVYAPPAGACNAENQALRDCLDPP